MAHLLPCPTCKKLVSEEASDCPACGHPLAEDQEFQQHREAMRKRRGPAATVATMVLLLGGLFYFLWDKWTQPVGAPRATVPASQGVGAETDAAILDAIKGSDDLEVNRAAFLRGSRLFLAAGGSLAALHEMGGWIRSQSHKPRRVYFTYKPPGLHVSQRYYFDAESGALFQ